MSEPAAMPLFHITTTGALEQGRRQGVYTPASFAREGFIHCSYASQVAAVANRLFRGQTDLVLLHIDPQRLTCRVVDENLEGGSELYPHVYGALPLTAIVAAHPLVADDDGVFTFDSRS